MPGSFDVVFSSPSFDEPVEDARGDLRTVLLVSASAILIGSLSFLIPLAGTLDLEPHEYASCAGIVTWVCYYTIFAEATTALNYDCVIPGIACHWWPLYVAFATLLAGWLTWYLGSPHGVVLNWMWIGQLLLIILHTWFPSLLSSHARVHARLVLRDRVRLLLLTLALSIFVGASYMGCQLLSLQFVEASASLQAAWFLALRWYFYIARPLTRKLTKAITNLGACADVNIDAITQMVLDTFYFVFFRQAFQGVKSEAALAKTVLLHVAAEFHGFVFLLNPGWFRQYHTLMCLRPLRYLYSHRDRDPEEAFERELEPKAIKYGNRFFVTVASLILFSGKLVFTEWGYNQDILRFHLRNSDSIAFHVRMTELAIMIVVEIILHIVILVVNRRRLPKIGFLRP